ncbi:hypothetical protein WJX82_002324 [Trebouxia sp. C0006]
MDRLKKLAELPRAWIWGTAGAQQKQQEPGETATLGKRKASERTGEASQEPRHSKRAAVDAAVPGNTAATESERPGAHSTGGLQDATIRGQGADTRGHKRAAETQSASDYQGVATHSGIRQPEAKRPAPSFHEQSGAASKSIVSKRYRVVREPFTAPLTPVEQANLNAQQNKKRRRHRVQFAAYPTAAGSHRLRYIPGSYKAWNPNDELEDMTPQELAAHQHAGPPRVASLAASSGTPPSSSTPTGAAPFPGGASLQLNAPSTTAGASQSTSALLGGPFSFGAPGSAAPPTPSLPTPAPGLSPAFNSGSASAGPAPAAVASTTDTVPAPTSAAAGFGSKATDSNTGGVGSTPAVGQSSAPNFAFGQSSAAGTGNFSFGGSSAAAMFGANANSAPGFGATTGSNPSFGSGPSLGPTFGGGAFGAGSSAPGQAPAPFQPAPFSAAGFGQQQPQPASTGFGATNTAGNMGFGASPSFGQQQNQPAMFGAGQQQSGAAFGAPAASAPSFAFGQQPSNGSAPTFGQPAPAPAFGQAPAGMAPAFSGAFGGAPGAGTFAAGSSGSAPARRKVNVRRKR